MLGGNRSLEKQLKTAIWQRFYNNKKICYRQSYRHPQKLQRFTPKQVKVFQMLLELSIHAASVALQNNLPLESRKLKRALDRIYSKFQHPEIPTQLRRS
jgi:hypothetical protein